MACGQSKSQNTESSRIKQIQAIKIPSLLVACLCFYLLEYSLSQKQRDLALASEFELAATLQIEPSFMPATGFIHHSLWDRGNTQSTGIAYSTRKHSAPSLIRAGFHLSWLAFDREWQQFARTHWQIAWPSYIKIIWNMWTMHHNYEYTLQAGWFQSACIMLFIQAMPHTC